MAEEIKPEEIKPEAGAGTDKSSEVDYEALYKTQAEKTRVAEEAARNLRKGYDKYKAIAKNKEADEDDAGSPDIDAIIDAKVKAAMADTEAEVERRKLEEVNLSMARKLKELSLTVANKSQLSTTGQGAGGGDAATPNQEKVLSPDQITALKARGWTDAKIELFKKNKLKVHSK